VKKDFFWKFLDFVIFFCIQNCLRRHFEGVKNYQIMMPSLIIYDFWLQNLTVSSKPHGNWTINSITFNNALKIKTSFKEATMSLHVTLHKPSMFFFPFEKRRNWQIKLSIFLGLRSKASKRRRKKCSQPTKNERLKENIFWSPSFLSTSFSPSRLCAEFSFDFLIFHSCLFTV
jgi:hypothetical protein